MFRHAPSFTRPHLAPLAVLDRVRALRPPHAWLLFGWLVVVYVWTYFSGTTLRTSGVLGAYTALMLLTTVLHAVLVAGRWPVPWRGGYFVVQSVIVLGLTFVPDEVVFISAFGLCVALSAEAVVYIGTSWRARLTLVGIFAILLFAIARVAGWDSLYQVRSPQTWLPSVQDLLVVYLPITGSVVSYAVFFKRQARAQQQAHALLQEVADAHTQLAAYADQVEELTRLAERQRLARELHDTLAQGVAGLTLQLEAIAGHLAQNNSERAGTIVQHALLRARTTLAESRRAIDDLRERVSLDEWTDTVRAEIDQITTTTPLQSTVDVSLAVPLPPPLRDQVRRVVREGVLNAVRHAGASHLWVTITSDETVQVAVRDNGVGFDSQAVAPGHYGLLGLHERARSIGGHLDISSAPGAGTTLRFTVPLVQDGAA